MRKTNKRGFTIVELVIVIAVIAILAAVLIPTFSNLVKKANQSNDIALAKNMNTLLAADEAANGKASDMYDVLIALEEGGFKLDNLNPRTSGNVFAWDKTNNQIVYLSKEGALFKVQDFEKGDLFITTRSASTFEDYEGYSFYMVADLSATTVTLKEGSSLDTGEYTLTGNVQCETSKDVEIKGTINGTLTVNSTVGTIVNYSVVNAVVIEQTASTSYHEKGNVKTFTVKNSVTGKVVFENEAYVVSLTQNTTNGTVQNNGGYIGTVVSDAANQITATDPASYTLKIATFDDLVNFRDKVNSGVTFADMTVELTADIDISGRAWTPIGAIHRDSIDATSKVFQGTFDGKGHTISGLTNTGFRISPIYSGSNGTTTEGYLEYVFGLFGSVYNATIQNLNMSNVNIDLTCDPTNKTQGDSIGAVVGYANSGSGDRDGVTIQNCHVLSGTISGFDATAGVIGRIKASKATVTNCSNAATVTSSRRAAGIIGFVNTNGKDITVTNCENKGSVTCLNNEVSLGIPADMHGSSDYNNTQNYHQAAGIFNSDSQATINTDKFSANTNSGSVRNESTIPGACAANYYTFQSGKYSNDGSTIETKTN